MYPAHEKVSLLGGSLQVMSGYLKQIINEDSRAVVMIAEMSEWIRCFESYW